MKIEQLSDKNKLTKSKQRDSFASIFRNMELNQVVRLTTAREALNFQGIRANLKREGYKLVSKLDGDDILVYKIK